MIALIIFSIIGLSAMILPLWLNGCTHEWEVIDTHHDKGTITYNTGKKIDFHNITYVQKCRHCGKIKHYIINQ